MEIDASQEQNGVGEDCSGENIQNLNDPQSENPYYAVNGLLGFPKKENGDVKFQMAQYSSYPFSNYQHPHSGLLPMERDEEEDCKKNEVANPEPGLGGEEDDCTPGKDNDNPPPKPTTSFNRYKLVDDFIFCDRSLVGRFTRVRPSLQELSQWSKTYWVSKLRSIWMFRSLGEGFFKIEFFDEEDCHFVLENGPWFMGVAGLSLKRWTPQFDPQNPGPLKTPVRMTLPDLPPELWNDESLIKICSAVGRVLDIVHETTEIARVCVEVDLSKGLLPMLDLQCGETSLKQELDYEGIPFRCKVCRSAEHLEGACPKKSTKTGRKKGAVIVSNGLQRMPRT